MTAPTHIAFALLATAGSFSLVSVSMHKDLPVVGCAILGSLLPDVDSPKSTLGRLLPFVSVPLERRYGHRTVTHSLLAVLALAAVTAPLLSIRLSCYAAILIGYISHLMADSATKSGVPLFYPNPAVCVFPGNAKYRVRTGSMLGEGLVLIGLLILLMMVMPISRMGGMWRSLRYLMATPVAAYADYRDATTESVLIFEGRRWDTRESLQGEGLILDANPGQFWIRFEGRILTYGDNGEIMPDKSRVRQTGHPIQIQTMRVKSETWEKVVADIPKGGLVSGQLQASTAFLPGRDDLTGSTITLNGQSIAFKFADRTYISSLKPVPIGRSERIDNLRGQMDKLDAQLKALKRQRPPAHYLDLRKMADEIVETQQKIDALKRAQMRFTGTLTIRIPGDTP